MWGAGRGPNNGPSPKLGLCSVLSSPASLLEESKHLWALTFPFVLVALGLYLSPALSLSGSWYLLAHGLHCLHGITWGDLYRTQLTLRRLLPSPDWPLFIY